MPEPRADGSPRTFLFLQGHPSKFWGQLFDGLIADGHRAVKVHLCLADWIFWGRRPALNYRGRYSRWAGWLRELLQREGVTDIFYYADRLPYHITALEVARELGIKCWAIEFGYLRPDWLTMEPEAMGAGSTFPKSRDEIEALAATAREPNMELKYRHGFSTEAVHEVSFHLLQVFGRPFYPNYVSDKIYWLAIEYLSWLVELALESRRTRAAQTLQTRALSGQLSYNLVAMQIQADYQIRASSHYKSLMDYLAEVMTSFACHAPDDRELVVKLHPLDNGLERWFARIPRLAAELGLAGRVHVIKGGDLGTLLRQSKGVTLVNSTVGLHSLRMGLPTHVAGRAVFNLPGLTHQSGLDSFWSNPDPVDLAYFDIVGRALTHIQIKGSFYNPTGREAAISEIRARFRRGVRNSPR
ncbi:MAG: capsular biosynthesis protein [Marinosulfonomonas sp.]|nr:capsular biosynthesis protein [Marinosulfonomonas sp.]